MGKFSSVKIDERSKAYIDAQISDGNREPSDPVQAALRLLEGRDAQIAALREALIEGEKSGLADELDLENFLVELRERRST